jgi:threonine synthase
MVDPEALTTTGSTLSMLECPRCGAQLDADRIVSLCSCGSPLLCRYDLERAATTMTPDALAARPSTLWRYREVLPVRATRAIVSLGEGMTPLLPMPRLGVALGVPRLLLKDEGLIPTGTFKARGAAVGVSRALELGVRTLAMPTNGNAGAAWALYAARAGIRSRIVMPVDAPYVTRAECVAAGAELGLVRGHIGDAARIVSGIVAEGAYDASTLKEPYRIEGKKTMGYEIAEQLAWGLPDVVVYPTGGGVGLIGVYKAVVEMIELGLVTGPPPRLVSVQAAGCAPIVRAFEAGARASVAWDDPRTIAFGINVPKALGDFLVLDAVYATSGTAVAVADDQLLDDQRLAGALEGTFICPEGAACLTAVRSLRASGWLSGDEQVVVLNTGAGLKYPETVDTSAVPILEPSSR